MQTVAAKGGRINNVGPDLTKMNPALQRNGTNGTSTMPPPRNFGRDRTIGKTVTIAKGSYKGMLGIVKDTTDTIARVELHSKNKLVNVPKSDLRIKDPVTGQAIAFGAGRGRGGMGTPGGFGASRTPVGSRVPGGFAGSRTPAAAISGESAWGGGGRTPAGAAHGGARTPAWGRAAAIPDDGHVPAWKRNADDGSRTPYGGDGSRTSYGGDGSRTSYGGRTEYGGSAVSFLLVPLGIAHI